MALYPPDTCAVVRTVDSRRSGIAKRFTLANPEGMGHEAITRLYPPEELTPDGIDSRVTHCPSPLITKVSVSSPFCGHPCAIPAARLRISKGTEYALQNRDSNVLDYALESFRLAIRPRGRSKSVGKSIHTGLMPYAV